MIVHLFDDQKFVDITINNFDKINSSINRYIVFSKSNKLKYVHNTDRVFVLNNSSYKIKHEIIFKDCSLLVIHFLTPLKSYIIKKAPPNVRVLWSTWGADFYDMFHDYNIYENLTKRLISKNNLFQFRKLNIYNLYHLLKYRILPIKNENQVLSKIEYLSTVLPDEYDLITKRFSFNPKYIDFNYGINDFDNLKQYSLANKVLIGNSATYSNNHLDVFKKIKNSNCEFICPLNYGGQDYKQYQKIIIQNGTFYFKKKITFLTEFLALEEYNNILLECNSAIMFHIRQQALANIFKLLFLGIRLFLNRKSILYNYFIDQGAIIFNLENDIDLLGKELSIKEKHKNKLFVMKLRGKKVIEKKYQNIIDLHNT